MKDQHIRLEYSCNDEYSEQELIAKEKFELFVKEGYPFVRIVSSHHPYSEGIWIEATIDGFTKLDTAFDFVIKQHISK